ncbi:hypothetical protein ACQP2T_06405 [Nonomuraea sp. CA-143628]|uniref:hypothetical protein n=1 Tax=Nonomuraea sp. CA-143628 TaxID=3239997 RepID=UPI003D93089B
MTHLHVPRHVFSVLAEADRTASARSEQDLPKAETQKPTRVTLPDFAGQNAAVAKQ